VTAWASCPSSFEAQLVCDPSPVTAAFGDDLKYPAETCHLPAEHCRRGDHLCFGVRIGASKHLIIVKRPDIFPETSLD
jgi:hypothetical protein